MAAGTESKHHEQTTDKQKTQKPAEAESIEQGFQQTEGLVERANFAPRLLSSADALHLQRTVGNRAAVRILSQPRLTSIQPKLTVGAVSDPLEQEADHVAEMVINPPASAPNIAQRAEEEEEPVQAMSVQRAPEEEEPVQAMRVQRAAEEEEPVQAKPLDSIFRSLVQRAPEDEEEVQTMRVQRAPEEEDEVQTMRVQRAPEEEDEVQTSPQGRDALGSFEASDTFESSLGAARGGGQPLADTTRGLMEERIGADFSGVKVHTDAHSDQLNRAIQAKAFTTGQDIFFRQSEFQPGTTDGQSLIAHELTHVVQQSGGSLQRKPKTSSGKAIRRSAIGGKVQRLWNVDEFKKRTYEGMTASRESELKEIEKLLEEYNKLNPASPQDIKTAQDMVMEIREYTINWIADNTDVSDRKKRMEGMKVFVEFLDTEKASLLKLEEKLKKSTNGKDNAIAESRREGKLQIIKDTHQGTAKSALNKLGFLLDTAVPNVGDKSEIEIEIKIPIDPTGVGFLGVRMACEAERAKKQELKARCELSVIGGAQIGSFLEVKGELGGYFEAQAANSDQVMKLISYALYRRFVESKWLPIEISNYMWGGDSSIKGSRKAERWAGNVEKEVFANNKEAYVETGGLATASAKAEANLPGTDIGFEAGGKIAFNSGKRYTAESITAGKKRQEGANAGLGTEHAYKGRGDTQESFGVNVWSLETSAEGKIGPFGAGVKGKWTFLGDPDAPEASSKLDEWELEGTATGTLPIHERAFDGLPHAIGGLINWAATKSRNSAINQKKNKAQIAGNLMGFGEDASIAAIQMSSLPLEDFDAFPKFEESEEDFKAEGEVTVELALKYTKKPSEQSGAWEIAVNYVKGMSIEAGVFAMEVKKSSRLFTITRSGGAWKVNPELDDDDVDKVAEEKPGEKPGEKQAATPPPEKPGNSSARSRPTT
jgi:hypothetical protein